MTVIATASTPLLGLARRRRPQRPTCRSTRCATSTRPGRAPALLHHRRGRAGADPAPGTTPSRSSSSPSSSGAPGRVRRSTIRRWPACRRTGSRFSRSLALAISSTNARGARPQGEPVWYLVPTVSCSTSPNVASTNHPASPRPPRPEPPNPRPPHCTRTRTQPKETCDRNRAGRRARRHRRRGEPRQTGRTSSPSTSPTSSSSPTRSSSARRRTTGRSSRSSTRSRTGCG